MQSNNMIIELVQVVIVKPGEDVLTQYDNRTHA